MTKYIGTTSGGNVFRNDGIPISQKEKLNITCFQYWESGHWSTENIWKLKGIDKYNTTKKLNNTINSALSMSYKKSSMDTSAEKTSTQMLISGLSMGSFYDTPYSMMLLNNAIQR